MLGDTITVTVNAVAKVLAKINQDAYTSEYLLRETTGKYSLKIRHSKDKPTASGVKYDRHAVDFTYTIFASGSVPEFYRRCYVTIVNSDADDATLVGHVTTGIEAYLNAANVAKVVGWES